LEPFPPEQVTAEVFEEGPRMSLCHRSSRARTFTIDAATRQGVEGNHKQLPGELCNPELLCYISTFLHVQELAPLWSCRAPLWQRRSDNTLWQALYVRRRWGGVVLDLCAKEEALRKGNPRICLDWQNLYRNMLFAEASGMAWLHRHLKETIPGVFGPLALLVRTKDACHRDAALCALHVDPIVTDSFTTAAACLRRFRELREEPQQQQEPLPDMIMAVPLDNTYEDPELEERLVQLRGLGGTCKLLVDCFDYPSHPAIREGLLPAAIRALLGAMLLCDGEEEAETLCMQHKVDVVSCQTMRIASYVPHAWPPVSWTQQRVMGGSLMSQVARA